MGYAGGPAMNSRVHAVPPWALGRRHEQTGEARQGIIVPHATEPAWLLPPSRWPKLVRSCWTLLRTSAEARRTWERLCQLFLGVGSRPTDCNPAILLDFLRRFEPRRLPQRRTGILPWPCASRCSRLRVCPPRSPAAPHFARRWRTCSHPCWKGWSSNRGPHPRCRCYSCDEQEGTEAGLVIARRIARMIQSWQ